jgi:hypothetical protein
LRANVNKYIVVVECIHTRDGTGAEMHTCSSYIDKKMKRLLVGTKGDRETIACNTKDSPNGDCRINCDGKQLNI